MQQTVGNIWMTFISYHSIPLKRVSSNRTYMAVGKDSQLFDLNSVSEMTYIVSRGALNSTNSTLRLKYRVAQTK